MEIQARFREAVVVMPPHRPQSYAGQNGQHSPTAQKPTLRSALSAPQLHNQSSQPKLIRYRKGGSAEEVFEWIDLCSSLRACVLRLELLTTHLDRYAMTF